MNTIIICSQNSKYCTQWFSARRNDTKSEN